MNADQPFSFTVHAQRETFSVSSFRAQERLSGLFRAEIQLTTGCSDESLASSLVGEPATFLLFDAGAPVRAMHGIIARADSHGRFLHDRQAISVALVPALWKLERRTTRRIFQDQTTLEIASTLFREWDIPSRFSVQRNLPTRAYSVQYDETDYAYVMRLFAEEGLFTYFEHPLSAEPTVTATLVVADAAADYVSIQPNTPLCFERVHGESGLHPRENQVTSFVPKTRDRAARALLRGYDFRRPRTELRDEAGTGDGELRVVYEHEGSYEDDLGQRPAAVRLEQARRKAQLADGASFCRRLLPGASFTLENHELSSFDGHYVVTRLEHEGYAAEVTPKGKAIYQNRFRCAPANVVVRPSRMPAKPRQVAETAVVVGPATQEIYTDAHGRIKVQFPWDLAGRNDETSSCWVRVSQAWAGAGWGAQLIPRVGMEVVVTFLGGDLDRPLVTGCVYNATHTPPFQLPQNQTRNGIRTSSTPGAQGSNELSFDDAAGSEQVFVHAQRNYDEVIDNNKTSRVRGASSVEIARSQSQRVGENASLHVAGDNTTSVGGDVRFDTGGNWKGAVSGDRTLSVEGDSATTVMRKHSLEVRGDRSLVVGRDGESGQSDHYVYGSASLSASERIVVRATQSLLLQCGDASIELTKDRIVLRAPTVELSATNSLEASTKGGPSLTIAENVEILAKKFSLFTESGALEVDKDFKAEGKAIKLGYDPSKPDKAKDDAPRATKPFNCKFSNYFFRPFAHKTFHLMTEGLRFEGETDADGVIAQDIPEEASQAVVRLWIDEYPEGRQRQYNLKLTELPPPEDILGAKSRLKNLGYYVGPMDANMNDALRSALAELQIDHQDTHGLEPTGELDEGTAGALEEIHRG